MWWLVRKPISEKTIVDNVLRWGTGGLNIDGTRISSYTDDDIKLSSKIPKQSENISDGMFGMGRGTGEFNELNNLGRFPANLIHDGSEEVMEEFEKAGVSKSSKRTSKNNKERNTTNLYSPGDCVYGDENTYGDTGTPARFFYCSKPSTKERNMGCDELEDSVGGGMEGTINQTLLTGSGNIRNNIMKNNHPTIKSVRLMAYLITLITPPQSTSIVLDPFMGSGTTGIASLLLNKKFIGIEKEEEYIKIAETRIKNYEKYRQFLK